MGDGLLLEDARQAVHRAAGRLAQGPLTLLRRDEGGKEKERDDRATIWKRF